MIDPRRRFEARLKVPDTHEGMRWQSRAGNTSRERNNALTCPKSVTQREYEQT